MKFDFSNEAYFDNHTHPVYLDKCSVTTDELIENYYHGVRDELDAKGNICVSRTGMEHLRYLSVNMALVNAVSERFGVEPTLEAVTDWRNSLTKTPKDLKAYTDMLFKDANVSGCTLDSGLPMGDPETYLPCTVFRLFRYEPVFHQALQEKGSFAEIVDAVLSAIKQAKAEGFAGLKGHLADKFVSGFHVREVSDAEATAAMPKAKAGDKIAESTVYYAVFGYVCEYAGQLKMPLHLHTGSTGFERITNVDILDPLLMADYLKNPRYLKTRLVLLHGSFPNVRNAAWMAYNFPNVYLDLSWTQLWQGIMGRQLLEDALSITPHD